MRILKRPMFKYGGPINEGVMHGMRNNYAGGQRVGATASGRVPMVLGGGLGLAAIYGGVRAALPWAARMGARILPKVKRIFGTTTPATVTRGTGAKSMVPSWGNYSPVTMNPAKFNPNWLGRDPLVQGLGWAGKALTSPTAGGIASKALRFAGAPSTLIGGLWFANGRWFNKKGEELDPNAAEVRKAIGKTGGPPGGGDPGMRGTGEWFEAEAQKKLAADAKVARKAKLEKYLDTMGYDKAKKTAMGDALIDASAIVQDATTEAGSLKKADWGKMINKAIQSTSKRLDKPEQIREAVGLMLTKSEIEKDLEDPQVKRMRALEIEKSEKALAGESLQESINAAFQKSGKFPTGSTLAGVARTKGIEVTKVIPTTEIPDDMSAINYLVTITEKAKKDGNPMPKGHYVIKDRLVEIDVNGDIIKQVI